MNGFEPSESDSEASLQAGEVAHCPQCMTPFDLDQHYCGKCGYAVGQYTPYVPFVNIPFQCSVFQNMWRMVWRGGSKGILKRILFLAFIALMVPLMLIGLPFTIYEKICKRRGAKEDPVP